MKNIMKLTLVLMFLISANAFAVGGSKTEPPESKSTIETIIAKLLEITGTKK